METKDMADLRSAEEKFKEATLKRMGEISSRRNTFWKAKEGQNRFRVLRAKEGDPWYVDVEVHYGLGPEGKDRATCLVFSGEDHCPACDAIAKLKASSSQADRDRADRIKSSHHCMMNILDLDAVSKGVQIWSASETKAFELMEYYIDPEWGDFTHPRDGYEIRMKRSGTGRTDTTYGAIKLAKNPSPLPDAKILLGQLKNLEEVFQARTAAEMQALLDGDGNGDFPCFGKEYESEDETCDACEKASACRKSFYEAKKASKAGKNGKDRGRGKPARHRVEEDE